VYTDETVKRYVVRDKEGKELNCCADERVANAYCDYYNELESMQGCTVQIEKRREAQK
jgi:hypothetical protein